MTLIKPLATEEACNTTPKTFNSAGMVRVINTTTAARTIVLKEVVQVVDITVNTSVNATTGYTLSSGTTDILRAGMILVNSSNVQVVNTDIATLCSINSITNSTSFATNNDIIIANGSCTVGIASLISNTTILGNTTILIAKGRNSTLHSNNGAAEVLAQSVTIKG
jgi:hypothetical protein